MSDTNERRRLLRTPYPISTPALFLDRDGVLIEDRHYLCDPTEVTLCPGSKELVKAANQKNWAVVLITNQSGIARGYFDWSDYERVTDQLLSLLGKSAPLAGIYANGHGPEALAGSWRKPSPAMLLEASRDLNLNLKKSLLVGDRLSDMEAWAKRQQTGFSQNLKTELWFLDSLLAFPTSLLSQDT